MCYVRTWDIANNLYSQRKRYVKVSKVEQWANSYFHPQIIPLLKKMIRREMIKNIKGWRFLGEEKEELKEKK